MARPQSVEDADLIERLSKVFRDAGYNGASLADLSEATGLKKASLYHRFPGGKQQMAEEVLVAAASWYDEHIFSPLQNSGSPRERLEAVSRQLDKFYSSGRQACLLNMLSAPRSENSPFFDSIKATFKRLIGAFAAVAEEAGQPKDVAALRAERAVMMLHGSLVLTRGLQSGTPFKNFLSSFVDDLIGRGR